MVQQTMVWQMKRIVRLIFDLHQNPCIVKVCPRVGKVWMDSASTPIPLPIVPHKEALKTLPPNDLQMMAHIGHGARHVIVGVVPV